MLRHFTALAAFAIVLAGCKGGGSGTGESTDGKKVFRYNAAENVSSLDPAFARNQANIWAINQLFNGLVDLNKDLHVEGALAESYTNSDGGRTYTFNIRKGVMFHDNPVFPNGKGREVTAEDFVYTFKRIMNPATASTGAWIFNDKVLTGPDGKTPSDTCFKAVDKYTLRIYLRKHFPPFLQTLAMPYAYVVPKEAIEKHGKEFRRNPVGTGPFTFSQWNENESLVLLKNPNYWRKDPVTHQQLPFLDAVQVSFIPDKNQAFSAFQQGKLDFFSGLDESSREVVLETDGKVKKEINDKYNVTKVDYLNTEYIGFQLDSSKYENKKHPFLDRRVRQAMSYAIDREDLVRYLRNNLGKPGKDGMVPPAMPSYDSTQVAGYGFDLEKAQQLLKEAGYANGKGFPEVTLSVTTQSKSVAELLQRYWGKLGLNVKIDQANLATHQERVDNGRVQLFKGSWLGDYPDAENYLSMFYSKNFAPAGPNKTHFRNRAFDDYFDKSQQQEDPFERYEMYHKMDELVMREAPVIVLFYDEVLVLTQKNVTGLETSAMNNLFLEKVRFSDGEATAQR